MREITTIYIHCTDTPDGSDKFTLRDIDRWHAARGFKREADAIASYNSSYPYIGYHEVIDIHGKCLIGRGENEIGEHVSGHNTYSIAVCLMGVSKYTLEQWEALKWVISDWKNRYGDLLVKGHRDDNQHKSCPGFSVQEWLAEGMEPLEDHLLGK